jgi:hypothetical protein
MERMANGRGEEKKRPGAWAWASATTKAGGAARSALEKLTYWRKE